MRVLQPVPEIGKSYNFFSNGTVDGTRVYKAVITNILSIQQASQYKFADGTLLSIWEYEKEIYKDFYAKKTDVFVEAKIEAFSLSCIYFCRCKDGGWYSFDVNTINEAGRLDINGSMLRAFINYNLGNED